jgi:hypothetical protein
MSKRMVELLLIFVDINNNGGAIFISHNSKNTDPVLVNGITEATQ